MGRVRNQARWDGARGDLHNAFRRRSRINWPWVRAWSLRPANDAPAELDDYAEFIAGVWIRPTERAPREQPWVVHGVLRQRKQLLVVSELDVEPNVPGGGEVTGTVLRALNIAQIRQRAMDALPGVLWAREAMRRAGVFNITDADVRRARRAASLAAQQPLNRGRRGYGPNHYRRIALRYLELVSEGRRNVLVALAAEEGRPRETVRDWVRRATELGFLSPGKQGRAEARPGPNLYRIEENDA